MPDNAVAPGTAVTPGTPDPAQAAVLGPAQRADALQRLGSETFDVVVIGGGVVGTGVALDAASRGLSVALVEARDFAAGTSSRSSKLIHGGLRYLEQLDFGLVREALQERTLLLTRIAPHLVQPVPFMLPLVHRGWERLYLGAGILLYDTMGGATALPRHRHLSRRKALALAPSLRRDSLIGAIRYYDGQVDDARHTLAVARTAARYGAVVGIGFEAVGFLREGERVTGVRVRDLEAPDGDSNGATPATIDIDAHQVVNATGVWTDEIQQLLGGRGRVRVRASKGVHLVVPRDRLHLDTGLILRTETSVLFVIPWGRHWIIGTTDTDWSLHKAHPAASSSDIDYLLERVNTVLRTPLVREDVQGVYAGLRPLLSGESEATSQLSREHAVGTPVPGLVVIAGGKYTTYRVMAKDAVDTVVHALDGAVPESVTHEIPLLGADGYPALWNRRAKLAKRWGLHVARIEHLLHRYGSRITDLLAMIEADRALADPIPGAEDYLAVEARYAASHEGALHLDDVLTRRTRISIETWDRGLSAAEPVAELMANVLGWDPARIALEVEHYRRRVASERQSQQQHDDRSADVARSVDGPLLGLGAADALAGTTG
jgi:glycerol-3-phosphate dehydrogenase